MKILMVADSYPPRIGGLGKHVQMLSKELTSRGHKVIVFTIGYPDLPQFEEEDGVKVYRLSGFFQKIPFLYKDTASKKPPPIRDWLISKELRRILKEEKTDVVHAHGWVLYSVLPLRKDFRIPLVATLHDYGLVCPITTLLMGNNVCDGPFTGKCVACGRDQYGVVKSLAAYLGVKSNRGRLGKVDKFIAVSSYVRQVHLRDLGLRDDDIAVIPNFYAFGEGEEIRIAGWLPEDFILFVGALVPAKGIDALIQAYQKLNTQTKLVLIGARHPAYHYKNTENITIIENAPYEVVTQAYRNCRFAVFPSIWPEPCPTVTFEAMSHKKAIIVSEVGGFTDIVVNGETGILVPPNDTDALAQAINYLLENPKVAADMGQKGFERWKQIFTPDVVLPKIEELYQSVVE
jgi:glycosyltransferase involved in cell wall biosynthesis